MLNLPQSIQTIIYSYDNTFHEKYFHVVHNIKNIIIMNNLQNLVYNYTYTYNNKKNYPFYKDALFWNKNSVYNSFIKNEGKKNLFNNGKLYISI
jgi:hypothetical protein